mmetsp:Transcript_134948/g.319897  ORF Transcript_134948/g.319897 Transcript_134948/m.319897 type:complete len:206 (+) Transcript_134948:413-1030(+)
MNFVTSGSLAYLRFASSGAVCIRAIACWIFGSDSAFRRSGRDCMAAMSCGVIQDWSSFSRDMPCTACCTSGICRLIRLASWADPAPVMKGTSSLVLFLLSLLVETSWMASVFSTFFFGALVPPRKPFLSPPPKPWSTFFRASSVSFFFCSRAASAFCIKASATSFFSCRSSGSPSDFSFSALAAGVRLRVASSGGGRSSSSDTAI